MILCFNTAIKEHHVCLIDEKKNVARIETLKAGQESETILASIDRLFEKTKSSPKKLTRIMALTGPGGFTSLRIGLSVANQFAHQLKLPIIGLRSEEWFSSRTDEKDFIYLQSLNREEIYAVGFGKWQSIIPEGVPPSAGRLLELFEKSKNRPRAYLGHLLLEHENELKKNLIKIKEIHSPEVAWVHIAESADPHPRPKNRYDLLEPFYGKEPTITARKKL